MMPVAGWRWPPLAWHLVHLLSFACSATAKAPRGAVEYWQNCAARGPCARRPQFREAAAQKQPPAGAPKGHLQPLGDSAFLDSWDGEIERLDSPPAPEVFWEKYHKNNIPFLVKGAVVTSPAMNWTDEHLMARFGDEIAKVEWRNEDRLTDYCGQKIRGKFIHCPRDTIPYVESRTNIRTFIKKTIEDPGWAKYIISQMPDKMGEDWLVPTFFSCGKRPAGDSKQDRPWMTQLYENNFWYLKVPSGTMGTSTMHYDMNHQIMCLFAGKKEWFMWDLSKDSKNIPMWNEYFRPPGKGSPEGSDDSPIDGERVDLERWPNFAKARWINTTMEKGDCLYTPAHKLHYVRSFSDSEDDKRIIALMTMFQREERFDPAHCKDVPAFVRLSDFDVMWGEFPGSQAVPHCMNHIKMGYPNWKRLLTALSRRELSKDAFLAFWKREEYPKKRILAAWKKFQEQEARTGSWAERVFNSSILAKLAKDVVCREEGHDGPGKKLKDGEIWDNRYEYSLGGNGQTGYVDEKHADL